MRNTDRMKFVIGLVLLFGGLNLAILLSHLSRYYGVALIFAGIGVLAWAARDIEKTAPKTENPDNLASKIVHLLTFNGRFRESITIAGFGVLISTIAFNLFFSDELTIVNFGNIFVELPSRLFIMFFKGGLGSNDLVGLLLAGVLIFYYKIPKKYSVERDFALLFSLLLFILLVIPTTLLQLTSSGGDTNSPVTYYLLAMPTAALSRLFGIPVISPFYESPGVPVYHIMEISGPDGFPILLSISLSCSGLYSVAIFVSAFIAFVAVEYRKFDRMVAVLLIIGILLAWIANIIRMTIIVLVGYYKGADTMVWVHNNVGELIFMAWVSLFWLFMFGYFRVLDSREGKADKRIPARDKICKICGEPLSPTIPSSRCECGTISHSGCLLTDGRSCPSCGVEVDMGENTQF